MGDDGVGGIDDYLGRAVVLLQAELPGLGIVPLEIEDVLNPCPAEGVDALGVVADYGEVAAVAGQQVDYPVLRHVGILILVHQDMRDDILEILRHLRMTVQEDIGVQEDIVEIHDSLLPAFFRIQPVHIAYTVLAHLGVLADGLVIVHVCLCGNQIVLRGGYAGEHLAWLVDLVVELEFLDAHLDCVLRISSIIYRKRLRKAQKVGVLPEYTGKYGMESAHPQTARAVPADDGRDALLHLPGRLVGEGKGHDGGRLHARLYQARNLPRKHASFPGSGSGDDYRSSVSTSNCLLLNTVQSRQIHIAFFLIFRANLQKFYLYLQPNFHIINIGYG